MLHDGKWSRGREKTVQAMQRAMAEQALTDGMSVVVDDTNFAERHETTYRQMAERHGAEFEVKFFEATVEECVERDLKRPNPVGKDVILKMFHQHLCLASPGEEPSLPGAIIADVDGTLALMKDRGPFDWDKVGNDEPNFPVMMAVRALQRLGAKVLIVSGRDGVCESQTRAWLEKYSITFDGFWMRPPGNTEKDSVIKARIYQEHIKGKYHVTAVFDDRPQVVRLWKSLGLFVFDCGNGFEF
jgi:hypothetical protein